MAVAIIIVSAVALSLFFLIRREIRIANEETLSKLRDMMRKGHRYSDPDPSAAAPVTGERVAVIGADTKPRPATALAPVTAESTDPPYAIRGEELRRIVTVTRDDDPVHTRPTAPLIPPPTPSDQEASDQDAMRLDYEAWEAAESAREAERVAQAALRAKWEAAEDERERAREGPDAIPLAEDQDSADEVTRVFTGELGAADAMIPGVPVVRRRVIRKAAPRLAWPELTGDEDSTPPRSILPPPPDDSTK